MKLFSRPVFRPAFQVAATNVGPSVVLIHNEKLDDPISRRAVGIGLKACVLVEKGEDPAPSYPTIL